MAVTTASQILTELSHVRPQYTISIHTKLTLLQAVVPLHTFPSQDVFVTRHEQGTLIEMQNELNHLKKLNNLPFKHTAWPIAPIPELTTSFTNTWLFLVKIPKHDESQFPSLGDRFTIDMESRVELPEGNFSLVQLHAVRITNPLGAATQPELAVSKKYAAFRVEVPRSWKRDDEAPLELDLMAEFQVANTVEDIANTKLDLENCQQLTIRWDTNLQTFEVELAALRSFIESKRLPGRGPSPKAQQVFQMIQNFNDSWKTFYSLHDEFPHLRDPTHRFHRLPRALVNKFNAFTSDHRAAYDGLARIPNGLYFVNGCPGAGKTEWNMVVSALIQSKRRPRSRRRHSPILFMVDINQAVDDAANRYYALCKEVGLELRVIRMHGWPYEMRHSQKINGATQSSKSSKQSEPEQDLDFTKRFLMTAGLSRVDVTHSKSDQAPTLDEAAWQYYQTHRDEVFSSLDKLLQRMDSEEILGAAEWKALRSLVSMLYRAVLAQTDFIATTPAAAAGSFSNLFKPDVVFVDEAPHARELTTLIAIAYYNPIAWILTGDVQQTQPFVKAKGKLSSQRDGLIWNPYAEQLRLSMMARAEAAKAVNSHLVINKRAYGNLERLPSKLFYDGTMLSGHDETARWPPSTVYLQSYLEKLGNITAVKENRLLVSFKEANEESLGSSFWNPTHHNWLLESVEALLQDSNFQSVTNPGAGGTIMIQTPYSAAVRQYHSAVKQWPAEWQSRVSVLTVDKAQGNQADVVYLDMVRTAAAGFMDNSQRLNVALTRARQAEVIVMHKGMTWKSARGVQIKSNYTSKVWDAIEADGRLIVL